MIYKLENIEIIMSRFIKYLKWLRYKKPNIIYKGFNCGCCGIWVNKEFSVPQHKSLGSWWDTWKICDECKKINIKE
jgi:hypothetical protein